MSVAGTFPATLQQVAFADCWIHPDAQAAALDVLRSGWVTTGAETGRFEERFAEYVGAAHAVGVSSCTQGIELALRSLDLPPGSPVLVSDVTFCGAVHAITHAGLRPVLVDVDAVTVMPTPETTAVAAEKCGGAAAMVVVHWAGDPADVPALARAAGLPPERVVEDAAHGLGARRGHAVGGSDSAATVFSFYATKNLPIGEGGMVTTPSAERATWLRGARLHGMSTDAWRRYLPGGGWRYDVDRAGLKANMTDVQAAIGRAQLRHFADWQGRRRALVAAYDALLGDLPLGLPHRPDLGTGVHAWHLYAVRVPHRDELAAALAAADIGTSVHFIPLHRFTHFRHLGDAATMPGSERVFGELLSLPLYPRLTLADVERTCSVIAASLRRPQTLPRQRVTEVSR